MEKKLVRKEILNMRNNMSNEKRILKDKLIYNLFINSDLYKKAKDIFIYVSFGSEVNTHEIIKKAIIDKKNIYVPKIDMKKKEMIAVKIHSITELNVNNYGILEPINVDKDKIANDFDIIVMPGVAFDENGNRIGYGGGYYDKYLEKNIFKAKKVALAYEEQILERIESDFHDIKVDFIINTKKIIKKVGISRTTY